MKQITSLRTLIGILTIFAFTLIYQSCKKTDIEHPQKVEDARQKAIDATKARYGNVSAGMIYEVNKQADQLFYKGNNGQMTPFAKSNANRTLSCLGDCNTLGNPNDLLITYTLDKIERFYECETNDQSTMTIQWTVSVPFDIVNIAPYPPDPGYYSVGYLKLSPSGGSPSVLTADITKVSLGADPGCSAYNTIYQITYTIYNVANSDLLSGTTIEAQLDLANDCSLVGHMVSSGYVGAPAFNQDPYLPCNRIDKVYINPPGGGTPWAVATGNAVICSYPTGMTVPDNHQLEYRLKDQSGPLWGDQFSSIYNGRPVGSFTDNPLINVYTGVSNLLNTGTGNTYLIRYRNQKTGTCGTITPLGSNWTTNWTVETWAF